MASESHPQPATYRPSGKVNWARYLPALILALCMSMVMAFVLCWAFVHDWYYSLVLPAGAALTVGIAMHLAVSFGHCRSPLVATLAGALAGALMFLGYYHFHFVSIVGQRAMMRIDRLPKFIAWRMRNDFSVDRNGQPKPPNPVWNGTRFGIDLTLAVVIAAGLARARAGRAYCESCRRWMRRQMIIAPLGKGPVLARALTEGELDLLESVESMPLRFTRTCTTIDVEYCPGSGQPASPCAVYVTVKELDKHAPVKERSTTYLAQHALNQGELFALADKLPALRSIAILGLPSQQPQPTGQSLIGTRGDVAVVSAVDDGSASIGFSKRTITIQWLMSLTPIFLVLGGAGFLYAAWAQWPRGIAPAPGDFVLSGLLIGAGLLAAISGVVICWNNVDFLNDRYIFRLTRSLVRGRPDALVDPDHPEGVFVSVKPRKNWGNLDPASKTSDRGFLLVDTRGQQLLFEGLRERYRIPASALISCEIEPMDVGNHLFVTVVRARVPGNPVELAGTQPAWTGWEAPFQPRPRKLTGQRILGPHSAEALRQRIGQLLPEVEPIAPDPVGDPGQY